MDELHIRRDTTKYPQAFFAWPANVIDLDDGQALLQVDDLTKYVVVVLDWEEKDQSLQERIIGAIGGVCLEEGMSQDAINLYLELAGPVAYTKSSSKSLLTRLNWAGAA